MFFTNAVTAFEYLQRGRETMICPMQHGWAVRALLALMSCTFAVTAFSSPQLEHCRYGEMKSISESDVRVTHFRRNLTEAMFYHGYTSYLLHAFPADELKPLSCVGRNRTLEFRGSLDDALGEYALFFLRLRTLLLTFPCR